MNWIDIEILGFAQKLSICGSTHEVSEQKCQFLRAHFVRTSTFFGNFFNFCAKPPTSYSTSDSLREVFRAESSSPDSFSSEETSECELLFVWELAGAGGDVGDSAVGREVTTDDSGS